VSLVTAPVAAFAFGTDDAKVLTEEIATDVLSYIDADISDAAKKERFRQTMNRFADVRTIARFALGVAWRSQVLGYPTLALVAAMALDRRPGDVVVCMNGGHGEWFVQGFGADGTPSFELASLTPQAAAARGPFAYIAGNRASELSEVAAAHLPAPNPPDAPEVFAVKPDARFALMVPQALIQARLAPIYGRAPDAKPQARVAAP